MRHIRQHLLRARPRPGLRPCLPHQRRAQRRLPCLHCHVRDEHANTHSQHDLHRSFCARDFVWSLWHGGHTRRYEPRQQRRVVAARYNSWPARPARVCARRGRGRTAVVMRDGFYAHIPHTRRRVHRAPSVHALDSQTHQDPFASRCPVPSAIKVKAFGS
jgi:hypothetical protein